MNEGARRALALAMEANEAFETRVKRMCYRRRGEEDGERATPEACAAELGVPVDRVKMTLRRASLKIDLVRDETPLDVVFEDDEFLVVNKPPNLRFHPNHRFEGNSLLSRRVTPFGRRGRDAVHRAQIGHGHVGRGGVREKA